MKRLATLAACLLILSPTVHAEDEKIPQITTLAGETYKGVRIMKTQGDTVTIMHEEGIKRIQFSEMDEENGKLLGLEEYKIKNAEVEAAKKAKEDAEKQKNAAENQKLQWLKERRQIAIRDLKASNKKTAADWYELYIFQDDLKNAQDLKGLFGRPPDFQSGDSLCWNDVCWNRTTEKMDDIWVDKVEYIDKSKSNQYIQYTFKEYVFRCGSEKYEVVQAPLRIAINEAMWRKAKFGE
jgi:hypothetical protein